MKLIILKSMLLSGDHRYKREESSVVFVQDLPSQFKILIKFN